MLQKVTRLDSVPTAEETVLTTEVPTKESRLYTLLTTCDTLCKGIISDRTNRVTAMLDSGGSRTAYAGGA